MATKTISVTVEAWERLKAARSRPDESFSQVILRARWAERGITAGELLSRFSAHGPHFREDELDRIDDLKSRQVPPDDKWTSP